MACFLMCVHVEAELAAGLMLTVLLMLFAPFLCFWCSRPDLFAVVLNAIKRGVMFGVLMMLLSDL